MVAKVSSFTWAVVTYAMACFPSVTIQGLLFDVLVIFLKITLSGTVFVDQLYWQSAIAVRTYSATKGNLPGNIHLLVHHPQLAPPLPPNSSSLAAAESLLPISAYLYSPRLPGGTRQQRWRVGSCQSLPGAPYSRQQLRRDNSGIQARYGCLGLGAAPTVASSLAVVAKDGGRGDGVVTGAAITKVMAVAVEVVAASANVRL